MRIVELVLLALITIDVAALNRKARDTNRLLEVLIQGLELWARRQQERENERAAVPDFPPDDLSRRRGKSE